ncbi:MAG: hypothetical protein IID32_05815 [Planctomycetes bacterium]|nr:hypothetical protein [Planctomycetota bacterium]
MGYQEATGYCNRCRRDQLIRRKGTSNALHLILTLCTFGFWLIIWVLASVKFGGWRCHQCGGKVSKKLFG